MGFPDMPPGFMSQEQQRVLEQARSFQERATAVETANRRQVLEFAWLLCTCRPYFSWDERGPAQAGCVVHSSMMITTEGEIL